MYQENNISTIVQRITNNHSLSQPQQKTLATNIQQEDIWTVNLPCIKGNSRKHQISQKTSNSYTNKNNIVHEYCLL